MVHFFLVLKLEMMMEFDVRSVVNSFRIILLIK